MSAKYMSNIKSIGAFARLYCFVEICWNLHPFSELKNVFFANFRTFLKFSKCKALGDFLILFLERVPLKGCLGGISQNWNFCNWFEIRDIFRHWLLIGLSQEKANGAYSILSETVKHNERLGFTHNFSSGPDRKKNIIRRTKQLAQSNEIKLRSVNSNFRAF